MKIVTDGCNPLPLIDFASSGPINAGASPAEVDGEGGESRAAGGVLPDGPRQPGSLPHIGARHIQAGHEPQPQEGIRGGLTIKLVYSINYYDNGCKSKSQSKANLDSGCLSQT